MNTNQNPMLLLEASLNQIGASMMNDDFACKLLAWLYVIGGNTELTVTHSGVNAGILIAQKKLKLYGGEVPNIKLLVPLQQRIKELETAKENTLWLNEIHERYPCLRPTAKR